MRENDIIESQGAKYTVQTNLFWGSFTYSDDFITERTDNRLD